MKTKNINFVFSIFGFTFWFEKEWEFNIHVLQLGTHGHVRSFFSYSGGKNYETNLDLLFIHIL